MLHGGENVVHGATGGKVSDGDSQLYHWPLEVMQSLTTSTSGLVDSAHADRSASPTRTRTTFVKVRMLDAHQKGENEHPDKHQYQVLEESCHRCCAPVGVI